VQYPVKRVEQFFFQIHSARPGRTWSPRLPCCTEACFRYGYCWPRFYSGPQ
jgi:hypothetical protein